jgi:hypothetical protein
MTDVGEILTVSHRKTEQEESTIACPLQPSAAGRL